MGTLFFVHGTGVRGNEFDETFAAVVSGARRHGMEDLTPVGCNWGAERQDYPELIEAILPPPSSRLTVEDGLYWEILVAEPLLELALLPAAAAEGPSSDSPESVDNRGVIESLNDLPLRMPPGFVEESELRNASRLVTDSSEFRVAADDRRISPAMLGDASARAVTAAVVAARRQNRAWSSTAADASDPPVRLAERISVAVRPDSAPPRGVPAYVLEVLTRIARKYRYPITKASIEFVGDILFYARRGEQIRALIRDALNDLDPPVLAIGHSLGGIILLDVLTEPNAPRVDLLVTAGSQSPALYAVDALGTIRPSSPPPRLPRWLNAYDRSDLIAFLAGDIFQGVQDNEVNSKEPFPEAHGAYWRNPQFWRPVNEAWQSFIP